MSTCKSLLRGVLAACLAGLGLGPGAAAAADSRISLAGTWSVRLDPDGRGRAERWYEQEPARDAATMFLPGTTDEAGLGAKVVEPETGWLTRPYRYLGVTWLERAVVIPETWRGQRITLFLERPHWRTEVWVDGRALGSQNSLSTPHVYDLSDVLAPGRHRLTVAVDNRLAINVGESAHSVTEHTQTNWNGIVGRLELEAYDPVWIDAVALYPNPSAQTVRARVTIGNRTGASARVFLSAAVGGSLDLPASVRSEQVDGTSRTFEFDVPVRDARRWDEYEGALERMKLTLVARVGNRLLSDKDEVPFGMREIGVRGTQFVLNGRPIFLRGNLECAIFPLTGYASMRVEDWDRLFRIARAYGLNSFRFHSWCPPEAAFLAADRAGFLLQVELPVWSNAVGKDAALSEFMRAEGHRILAAYGNHPSFTMLCLGNELGGDDGFMDALVAEFKQADPRRLYTFSSDHRRRSPGASSDYYVTQQTTAGRLRINGTRFGQDSGGGTDYDFAPSVRAVGVPLVAHELGQWAVFPSYDEIAKYTGVLKARNLEVFRGQLEQKGMLDLAPQFQLASGRFSWAVYKEDIESALRTAGLGGFFLLQLQDFPGQGEALVGLLDSFWASKGILTSEEFRRFSSAIVPLARMKKFVWTSAETFAATAELANYGKHDLAAAAASWTAAEDSGRVRFSGQFGPKAAPTGAVTALGDISFALGGLERATHLTLTLRVRDTDARNDWSLWVYPERVPVTPPSSVTLATAFDERARRVLADGGTLLLTIPAGGQGERLLATRFLPVFWSNAYFSKQPGTLGILCDPAHPALAAFPTAMHADWQWWELLEGAHAFILDDTPPGFRGIVQVIDDFHRNHKLGAVIEARVGRGRLLATSFDLASGLGERPVARQLLRSLIDYAASEAFDPRLELSEEQAARLFLLR